MDFPPKVQSCNELINLTSKSTMVEPPRINILVTTESIPPLDVFHTLNPSSMGKSSDKLNKKPRKMREPTMAESLNMFTKFEPNSTPTHEEVQLRKEV